MNGEYVPLSTNLCRFDTPLMIVLEWELIDRINTIIARINHVVSDH